MKWLRAPAPAGPPAAEGEVNPDDLAPSAWSRFREVAWHMPRMLSGLGPLGPRGPEDGPPVLVIPGFFGTDRTTVLQPFMVGEDVGRYWLDDPAVEGTIFWVGGVPKASWDAANGDTTKLPSLHSPLWAPDAETVISTATEAMTIAALDILRKS